MYETTPEQLEKSNELKQIVHSISNPVIIPKFISPTKSGSTGKPTSLKQFKIELL